MVLSTSFIFLLFAALTARGLPLSEDDSTENYDPGENIKYRLPAHVVPVHYDIKLIPHLIPHNFTFDGEVAILLKIKHTTSNFSLHSKHLAIDQNQTVLSAKVNFDAFTPSRYGYNNKTEMITFYFDEVLKPDHYILHLKFTGTLNYRPMGFHRTYYTNDDGEKVWLAVANFEPLGARQAFPCMDEPALKSTFTISIKHQPNYTVLSNMPKLKQSEVDEIDGKLWTCFQTTPPMSTYLVSFLISDFVNVSNFDGTINVWCRRNALPSAEFPRDFAEKAAPELERYTNSTGRIPKVDHVAIPDLYPEAAENWGLITYKESGFLYDENSSLTDKIHIAMQIAHELAHHWFGNLVTIPSWSQLWLKEGLAAYLQYYITDKIYPEWHVIDTFIALVMHNTFMSPLEHTVSINREVYNPDDILSKYNAITYGKGPSIFRMLSHCLSEEVFRAGLIYYLQRHEYGVATPDDLARALQDALDESNVTHAELKVQEMMKSWTDQKGYPIVRVHRDYESGEVTVTQEFYHRNFSRNGNSTRDEIHKNKWWIPINFVTTSTLDFAFTLPMCWLKPEDGKLSIGKIEVRDWIIVNVQQTGYYRVDYDVLNWKKIADYLNTENYTNIHVFNRAQILSDSFELLQARSLDLGIFMNITKYLRREIAYEPWLSAFQVLKKVDILVNSDIENEHLKPYIWSLMDKFIENVGFEERPNDDYLTQLKRDKILHAACENYHPKCLRFAHEKLVAHLKDPDTNSVPPRLNMWTFCYGLQTANESIWYQVLDMTENSNNTLYLDALGCSANRTILEHYLNMSITGESVFLNSHVPDVLSSVMYGRPEYVDMMLDFIKRNWNEISRKIRSPASIVNGIAWQILTLEQLQKLKEFLQIVKIPERGVVSIIENSILINQFYMAELRHWLKDQDRTS